MVNTDTINKAKKNDSRAQRMLFEQLGKPIFMLCLRYVKIQEDAEEVMSTGFSKIFKALHSFDDKGSGSFEAWVRKIMVNECLMFIRKEKKSPLMISLEDHNPGVDDDILHRISADELYALILKIPDGYSTVFNLFEIEGFSHAEISEKLGISKGTSKSQLSKAKAYLKVMITKTGLHNAS